MFGAGTSTFQTGKASEVKRREAELLAERREPSGGVGSQAEKPDGLRPAAKKA